MKPPQPASLILLGVAALVAVSSRSGIILFVASAALFAIARAAAAPHLSPLLRRSRWLLVVMLVMFGWFTPGTPLPGLPGASEEGLVLAAESVARLLAALAVVALLLGALPAAELVAGLRVLLAPLAPLAVPRDRIAVRIALTLGEVEAARRGATGVVDEGLDERLAEGPHETERLHLPAHEFGIMDAVLGALAVALGLGAWFS